MVRRGSVIAFVEVKTRSQRGCGDPLESITARKRKAVEQAASHWLHARCKGVTGVDTLRFDAIAVRVAPGRQPTVTHLPDAWRIGVV